MITPKQFLRARRPKQFSDSSSIKESQIDRIVLEHYLDTLSSRSQEVEFERFGIRLCRAAISPNFMPNTGPTGGGDGKVDSETYPVSDITVLGWYSCVEKKAADERWGLAISVNKNWKAKVVADVEKAVGTDRNFKRIYFLSSKSISSRKRSETQDMLREKFGVEVQIMDRTWILDQIFQSKREKIAQEELGIKSSSWEQVKKGPLDQKKEDRLSELDERIDKAIEANNINDAVAEDSIDSAIIARELELPRTDIDGRFLRAQRLTKKLANPYLLFDYNYQYAWTLFWWHEDYSTFIDQYLEVEKLAITGNNIFQIERLCNLWHCLYNIHRSGLAKIDSDFLDEKAKILKSKLGDLMKDDEKPSSSLYARFLNNEVELSNRLVNGEEANNLISDLRASVKESRNLIGFPFRPHADIIIELGKMLVSNSEYGKLFEETVEEISRREGEVTGAKLLLDRGKELIRNEDTYQAIIVLGRSLTKLYKYESKDEIVEALYLISIAYEMAGLLWAARGVLVTSASLATSSFWSHGEINRMQAACYSRLKWLELRLGRMPQSLDWHQLDLTMRNALIQKRSDKGDLLEAVDKFELALGYIILRSDKRTLEAMQKLPDVLARIGMDFARIALLYALGHEDKFWEEFKDNIPYEEYTEFFTKWAQIADEDYLPSNAIQTEDKDVKFESIILGCKIIVEAKNQSPCLELTESVLAALESFLSTTITNRQIPRESQVIITVDDSAHGELISHECKDDPSGPRIEIHCTNFDPHSIRRKDQEKINESLFKIIVDITARMVVFRDEKELQALLVGELAVERSLNFTGSFITIGNVLGKKPKTKLADWIKNEDTEYPIARQNLLSFPSVEKPDDGENAAELAEDPFRQVKHGDFETLLTSRPVLWDEAQWQGVGFIPASENIHPPVLTVIFKNIDAGKKIFSNWKEEIGERDEEDRIRVTILTNLDQNNPFHYRVGIGPNLPKKQRNGKIVLSMTRMNTMTPDNDSNLKMFKESYDKSGCFLLVPGYADGPGFRPFFKQGIMIRTVNFRTPGDIAEGEIDAVLLK